MPLLSGCTHSSQTLIMRGELGDFSSYGILSFPNPMILEVRILIVTDKYSMSLKRRAFLFFFFVETSKEGQRLI